MIIRDRSFPHPVLAPFRDDVIPSRFDFVVAESPDADNYYIDVTFDYDNLTIVDLVSKGHAIHSVHIECRRNFYRRLFTFGSRTERLTIRASELVGKVEVSGFVRAQIPMDSYRIEGAHADYGDTAFRIEIGDILAVAPSHTFDAYNDYDPLRRISSILTVRRSDDVQEGAMKLDTSGDRIIATLSQKDYDRYTELKSYPPNAPLLANQIVVPALLEAVHEICKTDEVDMDVEMSSKRWFRSMVRKFQDMSIEVRTGETPPMDAVQALLKLPLRRSLEGILQLDQMD